MSFPMYKGWTRNNGKMIITISIRIYTYIHTKPILYVHENMYRSTKFRNQNIYFKNKNKKALVLWLKIIDFRTYKFISSHICYDIICFYEHILMFFSWKSDGFSDATIMLYLFLDKFKSKGSDKAILKIHLTKNEGFFPWKVGNHIL